MADIKEVVLIPHNCSDVSTYKLVILLSDYALDIAITLFNIGQGCCPVIQHWEHLLHATRELSAFFAFTLFKINAKLCGCADKIKHIAPKQMIIYAVHNNSNTNTYGRMPRA